jgi:hypothetical protein
VVFGSTAVPELWPAPGTPLIVTQGTGPEATPAPTALDLPQTAGTIVFLLKQSGLGAGNYPSQMVASSGGLVITPAGSVRLPAASTFVYTNGPVGPAFSITGSDGAVARWDSATNAVTVG